MPRDPGLLCPWPVCGHCSVDPGRQCGSAQNTAEALSASVTFMGPVSHRSGSSGAAFVWVSLWCVLEPREVPPSHCSHRAFRLLPRNTRASPPARGSLGCRSAPSLREGAVAAGTLGSPWVLGPPRLRRFLPAPVRGAAAGEQPARWWRSPAHTAVPPPQVGGPQPHAPAQPRPALPAPQLQPRVAGQAPGLGERHGQPRLLHAPDSEQQRLGPHGRLLVLHQPLELGTVLPGADERQLLHAGRGLAV